MTIPAMALTLLLAASVSAQQWVQLKPLGAAPAARTNPAVVYDPLAHGLVVFGGRISGGELNDVWVLDLSSGTWKEITPASGPAPSPRSTHNAVCDPAHGRVLIWSGRRGGTLFNDVWAFDLIAHTWTEFTPEEPRPNIRYGTAAVFDPLAGHLVTFAGFTDQGRFQDTWRFDPAASVWTEVTQAITPGRRCLHAASYDARQHRMLIYGGQRAGPLGDLWALDLNTDTWTELTPADSPAGRSFPASAYDGPNHRLLIFGGDLQTGEKSNEVWSFDLEENRWSRLELSEGPAARDGAGAAYVESEGRLLVFGGAATQGLFNDVWALEGLAPPPAAVESKSWGTLKLEAR
jgi:hypothetical protein